MTDLSNKRRVVEQMHAELARACGAAVSLWQAVERGDATVALVSADLAHTSAQTVQCLSFKLGRDLRGMQERESIDRAVADGAQR